MFKNGINSGKMHGKTEESMGNTRNEIINWTEVMFIYIDNLYITNNYRSSLT
jgi:hypothetical protein